MEELFNKFFKNITNPFVVLVILVVLYFPLSFLQAKFFPSNQLPVSVISPVKNINATKSTPQEFLITNYGMQTTNSMVDAIQNTDRLVNYLKVYPRVPSKDANVFNDVKSFFSTSAELYASISPLDLKDWWQSTYMVFSSSLKSQSEVIDKIDLAKIEKNSEYKNQTISSLEMNKSYIRHMSGIISNYVTLDYPSSYHTYDETLVYEQFAGLPAFSNAADYPYFGFPFDVDHDGFLETIFYTRVGDLQKGYVVRNGLIVFESDAAKDLKIIPISNTKENGFYVSEPKLTKYLFTGGVYKKTL